MVGALPKAKSVEIRLPEGNPIIIEEAHPRQAGVMSARQAGVLDELERWSEAVRTGRDQSDKNDVITRDELTAALDARVGDLKEKVAALEAKPQADAVDGLRLRIKALEERRGGGVPGQPVDLSPVLKRIEALERAPKKSEATYVSQAADLEPMKRTVEQIHEIATAAGKGVVEMTGHLTAHEKEVASLKARVNWLEETIEGITKKLVTNG